MITGAFHLLSVGFTVRMGHGDLGREAIESKEQLKEFI